MTCRICGKSIAPRYQFYCGLVCACYGKHIQGRKTNSYAVGILQALRTISIEHDAMALDTRRDVVQWLIEFNLVEQPAWWAGSKRYRISQQGLRFLDWVEGL